MATDPDLDDLPQATVVPPRRARFSIIWIVPILALVVAVGIAVQRYLAEGPTITITFKTADGIEAGKTFVKYKEVNIGQVTAVRLADNAGAVEVTAKIAQSAAALMVEDAKFFVVRPRISLSGVSGLSTLLSGNYIGFEAGASTSRAKTFNGLDTPPIITGGQPGTQFVLKAADLGSLGVGSPVYFRRLPVGQVIAYDLAPDGQSVQLRVFVNAPYDHYVTADTRFWNASGVDVSFGANGLDVRTQSLVSLLEGGVAFEAPPRSTRTERAAADAAFVLQPDRATAMKVDESVVTHYVLYFHESVRGLSPGAPVAFFGVTIGEVVEVGLFLDPNTLETKPRVDIVVYPDRVFAALPPAQGKSVLAKAQDPGTRHAFVRLLVEKRLLRAQLMTGSLVTGQRYVAFAYFPKAKPVKVDWSKDVPELPTVMSTLPEFEAKLGNIVDKIERMPLDAIGEDVKTALVTLNETLKDARTAINRIDAEVVPPLKAALEDARGALGAAEKMLSGADANLTGASAPGQLELRNAMTEIARAARSLRVLTDYLERHPEALIRGKTTEAAPR
ncbi:MAG: MlaD family protein [Burkholderiales bacterium]